MKTSPQLQIAVAILLGAATQGLTQTKETSTVAFRFRGVEPGVTTHEQLLESSKWGSPESRTVRKGGDRFWEYQPRGYKKIVVLLRGNVVQTIDVTLPAGVSPAKTIEAFSLGKPASGKLPKAALVGSETSTKWLPTRYTAGRVLLFIEKSDGRSTAKVMRIYADRVLTATTTPPTVAPPAAEVTTLTGQDDTSRRVVRKVIELLEKYHVAGRKLDDRTANRWMTLFIKRLDSGKYFFLQSDIDRFTRMTESIDDKARLGDIGFAYVLFKTYAQRRTRSMEIVNKTLAGKLDFTANEKFIFPTTSTAYPENELEAREVWRRRIKYDILLRKSRGNNDAEARDHVSRYYRQVFQLPERIDDDEILAWCLQDLAKAVDPHCNYYSARQWRDVQIQMRAQMVGIGAALKIEDGYTVVGSIVPGSPSAKDGRLQVGDRIIGVAQGDGEFRDVVGKRLAGVVSRIRGERGTVVRLKVIPKDQKQSRIYEITRDRITLQRIDSKVLIRKTDGKEFRIAVVTVPTYYGDSRNRTAPNSTDDTQRVLKELTARKVDLVVLDFRSNRGGALNEALRFPGLFLRSGPLLQVKDSAGKTQFYNTGGAKYSWDGPLIVLIDRFTSSGAEIFAAAVQDYRRGLLIGDSSTNGSASIQNLRDVGRELIGNSKGTSPQLGVLRVTTRVLYRVTGKTWQQQGIVPDVIVPSVNDSPSYGEMSFENSLKPDHVKRINYKPEQWVDAQLRSQLAQRSQARQRTNPELAAHLTWLRENAEWRSRTSTTLVEKKFLDAVRQIKKLSPAGSTHESTPDPPLNEAIEVAVDYLGRIAWYPLYAEGMRLLRQGEYAKSTAKFSAAITLAPESKIAHTGRALAYAGQGDWKRAIRDAKKAGQYGVSCRVTKATTLRSGTRTIAKTAAGTRVWVTTANDDWLWATLKTDSKTKGWIEKQYLVPAVD